MAALFLEEELNRIRAGRANVAILDGVRVESYGSRVPLNQVANVSVPDPRTIAIKPWDRKDISHIQDAQFAVGPFFHRISPSFSLFTPIIATEKHDKRDKYPRTLSNLPGKKCVKAEKDFVRG